MSICKALDYDKASSMAPFGVERVFNCSSCWNEI